MTTSDKLAAIPIREPADAAHPQKKPVRVCGRLVRFHPTYGKLSTGWPRHYDAAIVSSFNQDLWINDARIEFAPLVDALSRLRSDQRIAEM